MPLRLHEWWAEFIFWYFHDDYLIIFINRNNKRLISRIISCRPRSVREFFCSSLCVGSNRTISSLSQEYHPKFFRLKSKHSAVLLIEPLLKSSNNCLYGIVTVLRFLTAFSFDMIFVIFPVCHIFLVLNRVFLLIPIKNFFMLQF